MMKVRTNYLQGFPHHIGSSMGLNYDFLDLSENLISLNHFEKLNKADIKVFLEKWKVFEYYVFISTLKLGDNLIRNGTLCT